MVKGILSTLRLKAVTPRCDVRSICYFCGKQSAKKLYKYDNHTESIWIQLVFTIKKIFKRLGIEWIQPGLKNQFFLDIKFIEVCTNCGGGVSSPLPSRCEVEGYYASGAFWRLHGRDFEGSMAQKSRAKKQKQMICDLLGYDTKLLSEISVIEIGGGGALLAREFAKEAVSSVGVVELDSTWYSYYQSCGLEASNINELTASSSGSILIVASHVLEHFVLPQDFFDLIGAVDKPIVGCFIEVPLADEGYFQSTYHDRPHTIFFSQAALEALFWRHGYRLVGSQIIDYSQDHPSVNKIPSVASRAIRAIFCQD